MTRRTQLSYLDLAAFYQQAKSARVLHNDRALDMRWLAGDLADKLLCVIDAIRNDGLDPRWNPERDAFIGMNIRGVIPGVPSAINTAYVSINRDGADDLIAHLHQRGYKIVKDAT